MLPGLSAPGRDCPAMCRQASMTAYDACAPTEGLPGPGSACDAVTRPQKSSWPRADAATSARHAGYDAPAPFLDVQATMMPPYVLILLGLYNGARFLPEQLASYEAQTLPDWGLIVSDDGSSDESAEMVRIFAARHPGHDVQLIDGPRRGFARNFLHLIRAARGVAPFVALSDQDDVWLPQKLERAVGLLGGSADRPALYCARTLICDETLRVTGESPLWPKSPSFGHALVQNLGGGNTMVLNEAAVDLVARAVTDSTQVMSHDWFLYQLITGSGGHVIFDSEPVLLYRQHGHNQIGANNSWSARLRRAKSLMAGEFRAWNDSNSAALLQNRLLLTPEARATLGRFAQAREGGVLSRLSGLRASGVRRQTIPGNLMLFAACALGRL